MQPHEEQPRDQQPAQTESTSFDSDPKEVNHPVVTLSSDDVQRVETAYPVEAHAQDAATADLSLTQPVRWQAAEYIHHDRDQRWFIVFAAVTVVFIAIAVLIIKSLTFAILIPIMAAALVVYTRRPPAVLDYTLSRQGLHINDRLYPFSEFKSFVLVHGGKEYSIMLIPTKRFKPGVSVFFPEEAGEAIVDMLAARMPMEEMHVDIVDRLIQKLHL